MGSVLLRKLARGVIAAAALAAGGALAQRPDLARVEGLIRDRTNDFRREYRLQ